MSNVLFLKSLNCVTSKHRRPNKDRVDPQAANLELKLEIEAAADSAGTSLLTLELNPSAVIFDFFAAHEHGDGGVEKDRGGYGEGSVRDAVDEVEGSLGMERGEDGMGDLAEKGRVRNDEAVVYVDRGKDAGFQLEVIEFDGGDFIELEDEGLC
ncbi:hypothetical protein F3Y22_tig00002237pilonHSYRG00165 [Hibiscus syriacus]|uniref:Uncharacterized protein n=1 Tax=Hibiscus syriacus TaxID=106335 RepID=A0A6A3CYB2_HIBSY|nr:hypothetical protein F3Y22_tig00002237pilonHSYRG00165 [Hibiscus syriacus]